MEIEEDSWLKRTAQRLSWVTVVIIIAGGVLTFLLLFIFAKRQIMRFALRSHRGPHAPLGYDANKTLRREILRRIDAVPKVTYEPQMLRDEVEQKYVTDPDGQKPCHYYRMKVVDEAKSLEMSLQKKKLGKRHTFESLRSYFIVILTPQVDPRVVHQLCDLYEAARFNPKPFGLEEYEAFANLFKQLRHAIQILQPRSSSSTSRSPMKGGTSTNTKGQSKDVSGVGGIIEENKTGAPYIRRLSKKEMKERWTNEDEATALCHSSAMHEISIIKSSKVDESTAV